MRAVATCAVREAENSQEFLEAVRRRTGIEVDVISGEEEARLIHLAARSEFSSRLDPLFLVDIGGGSTEFVVSNGSRVLLTESLPLGAVRLADLVHDDPPSDRDRKAIKKAIRAVARRAAEAVRKTGFKTCVGSAGTIQSLSLVHEAAILGREPIPSGHRTLTRAGLKRVNRILRKTTQKEKLRVPGLDPRRRDIAVPGGILLAWILKRTGADGDRRRRAGAAGGDHPRLRRRGMGRSAPATGTSGRGAWTGSCAAPTPRSSMPRTSRGWRSSSSTRRTPSTS